MRYLSRKSALFALSYYTRESGEVGEGMSQSPVETLLMDAILHIEDRGGDRHLDKGQHKHYRRLKLIAKGLKLWPIPEEFIKSRDMRIRMKVKTGRLLRIPGSSVSYYQGGHVSWKLEWKDAGV